MKTKNFIFFCLVSTIIYPQSANEYIRRVQHKFNSINNFTANFSQNYFDAQGHDQGKGTGKFSYKKKNEFIVDLNNQLIVSDGKTIWNNDKRFNRVVISNLSDDPTSFSLERFIFDYPPNCISKITKEEQAPKGEVCIELTPKDQTLEFKHVKIWANSDGLISKLEVLDRGDMRYAFQFTDIKVNQNIPEQRFTFYPSKGMKIIDLR